MELTRTTHATADDGTRLAVHVHGSGAPLLCLPGGPMLDSGYFRDLGGLAGHRAFARLDLRGTGASGIPANPASYRCDRQVADVEAVRRHLGLDRIDLLAHSAGANLAYRYIERHPECVGRLLLVTPSTRGIGIDIPDQARSEIARARSGEPWYAEAAAALARVQAGSEDEADEVGVSPFMYGRWDDDVRAYDAWMNARRVEAAMAYGAEGAFDPEATRTALARLSVPVLVLAGGSDVGNPPKVMAEVAALFPHAELVVQEGAGHFPWVDDPERFVELVEPFVS
ncbi:MAG: proline iminopeptidase [Nocardioidaceae bacterium]|nr:proline iminopeptidase [Nocardioidaceae bacterium]